MDPLYEKQSSAMTSFSISLQKIKPILHGAKLVAVSKTQSIDAIKDALKAGQRVFGENRVQDAQNKFSIIRSEYPDIELHLIGPLQTNKVKDAIEIFDVIQTLDRPSLADAMMKHFSNTSKRPRLYVEINIGREPQKAGVDPEETEAFLDYCKTRCRLDISGLMCLPPEGQNPEPYFRQMKDLATRFGLGSLSMGMSADFQTAIACGATEVRLGTALFGDRQI